MIGSVLNLTDEMIDAGAQMLWALHFPIGAKPTPWEKVTDHTKHSVRYQVRSVIGATFQGQFHVQHAIGNSKDA